MLIGFTALSSCKKEEEVGGTAMQKMAGEWYLHLSMDGGKTFGDDYYHFSTYNTADNSSSTMWLDDLGTFWDIKGKVSVNLADMSFNGTDIVNQKYESKFTITDGKLLEKAAKAAGSKTVTDSLYFKVKFSDDDDPNTEYVLAGYRKTGFLEDEH